MIRRCQLFIFLVAALFPLPLLSAETVDLSSATIVIRAGELPAAEKIASTILTEEIARRTGINWKVATEWPAKSATVIAISTETNPPAWKDKAGTRSIVTNHPEAFAIQTLPAANAQPTVIQITGHDPRGALYGVGKLLRSVSWSKGRVTLPADFHAEETPDRPIRGHQIGYRDTANSWDAWTYDQFDQYFQIK